jgi:hypothetical protein
MKQQELEQQAQKEPLANQHHEGESPRHVSQKVPLGEKHGHEQTTEHAEAQIPYGAEIRIRRHGETPDPPAQPDNMGKHHNQRCEESQVDAK